MNSTEESPNVCIVGAGLSGICAAIQLQRLLNIKTFTIYDNQEDVGGVWRANNYPGCGNDNPSYIYTFSFAIKGDWSNTHVSSEETRNYLRDLSVKYDLYSRMKFNTDVQILEWNKKLQKWNVTINDKSGNGTQTIIYDIVIVATGHFHKPHYPSEFMNFKGTLIHTAEWDSSIDLKDKEVAVIGSGATTMQLIPSIVDTVKTLHSFQRSPIWNFSFFRPAINIPKPVRFIFSKCTFLVSIIRFFIFISFESLAPIFHTDSSMGQKFQNLLMWVLRRNIRNNEQLVNDLTPDYSIGCKRVGLHWDYFSAIQKPNVKVIRDPISKVLENQIVTENGTATNVDVLILATGFEVQKYFDPLKIIGREEENILDTWLNSGPSTFFGVLSHSMPNLFMLNGPASDSGHVSTPIMVEMQVRLMIRILTEMRRRRSATVSVKVEAEEKFMKDLKYWFRNKIQNTENCGAYYKNAKNNVTTLWPLTGTSYWLKTRFVSLSNFEFS